MQEPVQECHRWLIGGGPWDSVLLFETTSTGGDRIDGAATLALRAAWPTTQAKTLPADNGIVSLEEYRSRKVARKLAA